jgi:RHS repeat-associated protein
MTDHNGLHVFGYDRTYQLTSVDYPDASPFPDITYDYDNAGNRTSTVTSSGTVTYVANALNEYTSVGGVAQTYDLNGNLTSDGTNTYGFNAENRMVSAGTPSGAATYSYDPFMRRTKKTVAGAATYFVWSIDDALEEFDSSLIRQRPYVVGRGFAPLQVGYGPGLVEPRGDIHVDHLETPRAVSDGSATETWRTQYEAFGEAQVDPASTVELNLRFPGQYFDSETSLDYNRYRILARSTGAYLSPDPVRSSSTAARPYVYARSEPLRHIDPLGLWSPLAHDIIFAYALIDRSDSDVAAIMKESRDFDRSTQFSNYKHYMRDPWESPEDARARAEAFIEQMIEQARRCAELGDRTDALKYLARALHTMADSTSPEHVDANGDPKPYYWTPYDMVEHAAGETASDLEQNWDSVMPGLSQRMNDVYNRAFSQ